MYAAVMVLLFAIGSGGQRTRDPVAKKYRKESTIFGECVFYFLVDRTRGRANKLDSDCCWEATRCTLAV